MKFIIGRFLTAVCLAAVCLAVADAQHCINSYCETLMDCGDGCNICCHDPPGSQGFCAGSSQDCKPSPPKPPSTPWPIFQDHAALLADPWGTYYTKVYGEIPSAGFPLHVGANWLFYNWAIDVSKVTDIPALIGTCPTSSSDVGQRYTKNNIYSPNDVSWAWHSYPYQSEAENTWIEVMHQSDPFGDEKHGAWFIFTPGSGIYFNLGKTISFAEHNDAYEHFHVKGPHYNQEMSQAAAAAGYDSIQFTAHVDHVNYPCDTHNTGRPGFEYMGVEIVGTKLVGTYACTASGGAPPTIKAGWHASRECICDNKNKFLNCNGVPTISADAEASSSFSDANSSTQAVV
mmetsp:Transcript_120542/g.218963  ORF Transcript_120542/g.218963 Transcript_120542/m.218963 type:complete len:344 (-) Transcript_120542:43-1074(-)